jgi:FMN-dependent NADH-azoreductase
MKILVLYGSLRTDESITRQLAAELLGCLTGKNKKIELKERSLAPDKILGPDAFWIESNMTPENQRTSEMKRVLSLSDELILEIQEASHIVMAAPMYNFSIPWNVKAYVDLITRAGHTFGFDPASAKFFPLLLGKKLAFLSASAGAYSEAPYSDFDLCERYIRTIFGFMGITDVVSAKAENRWMAEAFRMNSEKLAFTYVRKIAEDWLAS